MVLDLPKLDQKVHHLIHHRTGPNRNSNRMRHHSRLMLHHHNRLMFRHSKRMLLQSQLMLHHKTTRHQHPILVAAILDQTPYQDLLANQPQVSLKMFLMHKTNILSYTTILSFFDYVRRNYISLVGWIFELSFCI